ncbi:unnamed protein product [Hermetia illucens]|uniref:Kazal-like domain-containing protein n=1 Tax=Hermetia illucens TaxID=343691 RepID=A0A7R8UQ58_HERIL|nr:extracellular protease inhibitor 10-like [Hermetia illucens]XP_037911722.1 extracellular protease inhibitor 10-like [Hermetia illucens]CAD7084924.1 unnamed protein product [Hermetia illucens]
MLLSWTLVFIAIASCGSLDPCAIRCNTTVDEPVCGYNGVEYQLFQNNCFLLLANCGARNSWEKRPLNECSSRSRTKRSSTCPTMCPMVYNPVCATDGNTSKIFGNQCEMNVANCKSNRWRATRSNACV